MKTSPRATVVGLVTTHLLRVVDLTNEAEKGVNVDWYVRESVAKIMGQVGDHYNAPALLGTSVEGHENVASQAPKTDVAYIRVLQVAAEAGLGQNCNGFRIATEQKSTRKYHCSSCKCYLGMRLPARRWLAQIARYSPATGYGGWVVNAKQLHRLGKLPHILPIAPAVQCGPGYSGAAMGDKCNSQGVPK